MAADQIFFVPNNMSSVNNSTSAGGVDSGAPPNPSGTTPNEESAPAPVVEVTKKSPPSAAPAGTEIELTTIASVKSKPAVLYCRGSEL